MPAHLPPHMSTTEPVLTPIERVALEVGRQHRWATDQRAKVNSEEHREFLSGYREAMAEITTFIHNLKETPTP